jgi:hypothetical protein
MSKLVKAALIVGILVVSGSVVYYLVIFLPGLEREKQELEKARQQELEEARQQELESCLQGAFYQHTRDWVRQCYEDGQASAECKKVFVDSRVRRQAYSEYLKLHPITGDPNSLDSSLAMKRGLFETFKKSCTGCLLAHTTSRALQEDYEKKKGFCLERWK